MSDVQLVSDGAPGRCLCAGIWTELKFLRHIFGAGDGYWLATLQGPIRHVGGVCEWS